jgi:3-oxoacyl-[acyl-carrier protein] reductase
MSSDFGIKVDLSGQIAMVTGASQGLGRACAIRLGQNGAKVLCVARNAEKLASTVDEIVAGGGKAVAMSCDVANRESVADLFIKLTYSSE